MQCTFSILSSTLCNCIPPQSNMEYNSHQHTPEIRLSTNSAVLALHVLLEVNDRERATLFRPATTHKGASYATDTKHRALHRLPQQRRAKCTPMDHSDLHDSMCEVRQTQSTFFYRGHLTWRTCQNPLCKRACTAQGASNHRQKQRTPNYNHLHLPFRAFLSWPFRLPDKVGRLR